MRFAQENSFFEGDFFRKESFKWKKNKKEMLKTSFFWKSWRDGFFLKHAKIIRKWDVKKFVVAEAIFVENILRSSKDSDLSLKKEFQKKVRRKTMTDLFTSKKRNSENKFLWWFKQVVILQKKVNVPCSNEHNWKKQQEKKERNNNGDKTKTVLQKKGWRNEKRIFSKTRKVNEGDFSRKWINWTEEA